MIGLFLALAHAAPPPPPPKPPPPPAEARAITELAPFREMALAIKTRDIPRFQAAWHPEGWANNLVGGSGLSGEAVAGQAKSEGWVLRSEPDTLAKHTEGEAWVVRCIVEGADGKALDAVHAVVVPHDGKKVVLGAGENPEEAMALAHRFVAKEPLTPPAKPKLPPPPE